MRDAIRDYLAADGTLSGLLTGGIYAVPEITRQDTPDAFDANGEIEPCALVKPETEATFGPYEEAGAISARLYVVVFFYQRTGYDVVDQALARTRVLLHKEKLESGVWEISWADDVLDQEDEALNCSLGISRYVVTRLRQ